VVQQVRERWQKLLAEVAQDAVAVGKVAAQILIKSRHASQCLLKK
jgi:hypothetical protein